jgi:hypothetical protein
MAKAKALKIMAPRSTSLLNSITIYQLVQKLLGGRERHTDIGDLTSLHFSFRKESRLKNASSLTCSKFGHL